MPVDRSHKKKKYACDQEGCNKAFARPHDLQRHKRTHCDYEEREFACEVDKCNFRANQEAGLKCHVNSVHENIRLPCEDPDCDKTFSDPSSRSKHQQKFHEGPSQPKPRRKQAKKQKAPYSVTVHARVARHIEEHSQQNAKNILNQFAAFALETSSSSGASSPPSSYSPSEHTARSSASRDPSAAP